MFTGKGRYSSTEQEIIADRNRSQNEYRTKYKVEKLNKHIQPLVDYIECKDEKEAREKIDKETEESQTSLWGSVSTTAHSFIGSKTNIPHAKQALKIILKAVDDCKEDAKRFEYEPIVVYGVLSHLSVIYQELAAQRWTYSPLHWVLERPRVLTEIESLFKEYDFKPEDPSIPDTTLRIFKCFH